MRASPLSSSGVTWERSVIPEDRYETETVAVDRHVTDRRERQVSGRQETAALRQFAEQTKAHLHRLFWIMLETVVPVGVVEADRKHRIACEGQALTARHQVDDSVPRRMAAGKAHDDTRCNLMPGLEDVQAIAVFVIEARRGRPKHGGHRL